MKILLVDDENILIYSLQDFFKQKKIDAYFINSSLKALELVKKENFDIVITDIKMPEMDGLELLKEIKNFSPDTEVIIITNYRTTDNAIAALKSGALDFLSKPVNKNEIWLAIEKANRYIKLKKIKNSFEQRLSNYEMQTQDNNGNFQIIGESLQIQKIKDLIKKIAATPDVTVLITGESGTGKDLTARNIHWQSERSNNPYIAINCSSFTPSLIESELFGYEKGAFTGASTLKKGLVEYADTGSLFLDEIGDMPLELQGAFLRVIENKQIRRLGGQKIIPVDIRVIAATNKNLKSLVNENKFRQDLFFRLNIFNIHIPPLRERKDDIPILTEYFIKIIGFQLRKNIKKINSGILKKIIEYPFPGNIRELKSIIQQAIILAEKDVLSEENFPCLMIPKKKQNTAQMPETLDLKNVEIEKIKEAIEASNGNLVEAAKMLNIGYSALRYRINKYNALLFLNSFKK